MQREDTVQNKLDIRNYDHIVWVVADEDELAPDAPEVAEELGIHDQWTAYASRPDNASREEIDHALRQENNATNKLRDFYKRVNERIAEKLDEEGYDAEVAAKSEIGSEAARLGLHTWETGPENPNPQLMWHAMAHNLVDMPSLFESAEQDVLAEYKENMSNNLDIRNYDHVLWVVFSEEEKAQDVKEVAEALGIDEQWDAYLLLPKDASDEEADKAIEKQESAQQTLEDFYERVHERMAELLNERGYSAAAVAESEIGTKEARRNLKPWATAGENPHPDFTYDAMAYDVVEMADFLETAEDDVIAEFTSKG